VPDVLSPRARGIAIAVVGIVAAVVTFLLVGRDDDSTPPPAVVAPEVRPAIPALAVSQAALKNKAASQTRPLYWAGPQTGVTYELTRSADGRTYVRYLTGGAAIGDPSANFLTVATYPQPNGFDQVTKAAGGAGATRIDLAAGGVAVTSPSRPSSVYLSYPGADYQVEVYSPDAATAVALVKSGKIKPVGGGTPIATGAARGLTLPALRALARVEPEIYWAGARPNTTYEVTHIPGDRTFVRYLPPDVKVGDPRAQFLTVATYPQKDALSQVEAAGARPKIVKLKLEGGGLAVLDPARPTSVFVAFPNVDFQIEVFSPKKGEARKLVERGRITPVG
jgi:hypothetical protein